jgi:hypothetical protein
MNNDCFSERRNHHTQKNDASFFSLTIARHLLSPCYAHRLLHRLKAQFIQFFSSRTNLYTTYRVRAKTEDFSSFLASFLHPTPHQPHIVGAYNGQEFIT